MIFKQAIPYFKGRTVGDIKKSDVQAYINYCRYETGLTSQSSLEKALLYVKQVFDLAIGDDLITKNPATPKKDFAADGDVNEREPLTTEKVATVQEEAKRLPTSEALLVDRHLFTGMRCGEVLGARWSDIDWSRRTITVNRTLHFVGNKPSEGAPKSKVGYRTIPMQWELIEILKPLEAEPNHYIVTGEKPATETWFVRAWERIEKRSICMVLQCTASATRTHLLWRSICSPKRCSILWGIVT